MSANNNFSLHDDASLDGSVPASNKGDAPAKPPQIITTNTLSNIKLPVLQKDDYDTWAMKMKHYLEYIDNEVWKVIQNGNSKKRVTKGKDGVYRVLPPTTQEEQFADEKERKARTLLLMAVPKDHLRRFHDMDDAKEIWAAIKTRFGGNAKHFARECKFKGLKEGSRQEASRGQEFKPVRTEKEALMTIDEGQIKLDSFNALKAKYDELQSEFGDQEAALTAHKLGLKKLESQLRASHKQQISLNEKLHFQANQIFEKDEKLKKYRRIGMKAVKDKDALQKIVDSCDGELGTVSDASSTHYSTCQSNDSDGELGTEPNHSEQWWNKANQFTPRPVQLNNIRPNLSTASNTIKTGRVNANTGHGNVSSAGTQFKSGVSRFNTGKQHVNSGRMYVNSGTQNKSGGSRVNTGKQNVNTARVNRPYISIPIQGRRQNKDFTAHKSNKYAVKGKMGTAVKTSAGCVWRKITPLSNTNSGPNPNSNVNVFRGPQGRPKPVKAWVTRINWRILKNSKGDLLPLEVA
ncbi:hypothetical protein Tco_0184436 [Tanacetum coccineum]